MTDRQFAIITASWNCMPYLPGCMDSVAQQSYRSYNHIVIDDATESPDQYEFIAGRSCEDGRVWALRHEVRSGALMSQCEGIAALNLSDEDVIVFLDGDDRLAHPDVLAHLVHYYDSGVDLTYGSYAPEPAAPVKNPAAPYAPECIAGNDYRNVRQWGLQFNHLRTMKYKLFRHLDHKVDLMDENGKYYICAGDTAVMLPCLEMAGRNHMFIKEVLLYYRMDSPHADWRTKAALISKIDQRIFSVPRKNALR